MTLWLESVYRKLSSVALGDLLAIHPRGWCSELRFLRKDQDHAHPKDFDDLLRCCLMAMNSTQIDTAQDAVVVFAPLAVTSW